MAASDLGEIRSKAGYVYRVTPEDVIWLARSVQFEGGDPASTIWTYAQRQAKLRRTGSLAALVQAHSQPINPLWATPGAGKCAQYPDRCTAAQIERRRVARTTPWESLRSDIRNLVTRWATAQLGNPVPKAIDFADATVSRSFIERNPGTQVVKAAGNWYLATPDTLSWPADFVTMYYAGRSAGPSLIGTNVVPIVGAGAVVVAAGFAGWAIWQHTRKRAA